MLQDELVDVIANHLIISPSDIKLCVKTDLNGFASPPPQSNFTLCGLAINMKHRASYRQALYLFATETLKKHLTAGVKRASSLQAH